LRAVAPDRAPSLRLAVRSVFLAAMAALSAARLVPLPGQAVLVLAAIGLVLNGAMALGWVALRNGLRAWTPLLDLGLLYVLVGYTPAPQ
jgi:hypothetical protein